MVTKGQLGVKKCFFFPNNFSVRTFGMADILGKVVNEVGTQGICSNKTVK